MQPECIKRARTGEEASVSACFDMRENNKTGRQPYIFYHIVLMPKSVVKSDSMFLKI